MWSIKRIINRYVTNCIIIIIIIIIIIKYTLIEPSPTTNQTL